MFFSFLIGLMEKGKRGGGEGGGGCNVMKDILICSFKVGLK
jgi:hypothetical protein